MSNTADGTDAYAISKAKFEDGYTLAEWHLQGMTTWPVFICYRQADGMATASRLYELLRDQQVYTPSTAGREGEEISLDPYFDQVAPGVGDWQAVHEPYLKRARAILVICTPGAKINEGAQDWVHKEIDWWLENRDMPPILIDPLGEDRRYVPDVIVQRWPDAQRIKVFERDWQGLTEVSRLSLDERVKNQLLASILLSEESFYSQELAQESDRVARLLRIRRTLVVLGFTLLVALGVASWIYQLKTLADEAAESANLAREHAESASKLAQARVVQVQMARAQVEAGLLKVLKNMRQYDAYTDTFSEWEQDFRVSAKRLSAAVPPFLMDCVPTGAFSVYEKQLVKVPLDDREETLYAYLAAVPGQSARDDDWLPAVLDVFLGGQAQFSDGRDKARSDIKKMMANSPPKATWELLIGLDAPHVLSYEGDNYRISRRSLHMNREGDMIMAFDVCLENSLEGIAK